MRVCVVSRNLPGGEEYQAKAKAQETRHHVAGDNHVQPIHATVAQVGRHGLEVAVMDSAIIALLERGDRIGNLGFLKSGGLADTIRPETFAEPGLSLDQVPQLEEVTPEPFHSLIKPPES